MNNNMFKSTHAFNTLLVSISQIVYFNDINIMKQEYDAIINNFKLGSMPKDEELSKIIQSIKETINRFITAEKSKITTDVIYQWRIKLNVWSTFANVASIIQESAVDNKLLLAAKVGAEYMSCRRDLYAYYSEYERAARKISRDTLLTLDSLRKQLIEAVWRLADTYKIPRKYLLTEKRIAAYNKALAESNLVKRYNSLSAMKSEFDAYPVFWYQIGSTANCIYRSDLYASEPEILAMYRSRAIECFEKYSQLNRLNLLQSDVITSSWALESMELQVVNKASNLAKAKKLIEIAEKRCGNAFDILELCAFAYLKIQDFENAIRLFHVLVNEGYDIIFNTQILSGLYIKMMRDGNANQAKNAKIGYKQLPDITDKKYVLKLTESDKTVAKFKSSDLYCGEKDTEINGDEEIYWLEKAADQGNPDAAMSLGDLYHYLKKDCVKAIIWYQMAAKQGCGEARRRLGECYCYLGDCYRNGKGVEKNFETAASWYEKVSEAGDLNTARHACISGLELLRLILEDFKNKQREFEPMRKEALNALKKYADNRQRSHLCLESLKTKLNSIRLSFQHSECN